MEADARARLTTARWIAIAMYGSPLIAFPYVGRYVRPEVTVTPETLRVLALVLGAVAVADYAISLWLETKLLARVQADGRVSRAVTAIVIVAAFGVSLGVYGLVLSLLGARGWGAAFYVLCAAHGLHLLLRWPRYERAAEGALR